MAGTAPIKAAGRPVCQPFGGPYADHDPCRTGTAIALLCHLHAARRADSGSDFPVGCYKFRAGAPLAGSRDDRCDRSTESHLRDEYRRLQPRQCNRRGAGRRGDFWGIRLSDGVGRRRRHGRAGAHRGFSHTISSTATRKVPITCRAAKQILIFSTLS